MVLLHSSFVFPTKLHGSDANQIAEMSPTEMSPRLARNPFIFVMDCVQLIKKDSKICEVVLLKQIIVCNLNKENYTLLSKIVF